MGQKRAFLVWSRVWMMLGMGLAGAGVSGCGDEGPDPEPQRTPPVPNTATAVPSITEVHSVQPDDLVEFRVSVRSVDTGADGEVSDVIAYLFRDYREGAEVNPLVGLTLLPGTTDLAASRELRINSRVPASDGCVQFTLVMTHADNGSPPELDDPADVGQVTWWFDIESDGTPNSLDTCETE